MSMKASYAARVSLNWWCYSVRSERLIKLRLSWCLSINEHTWKSYIIIVLENLLTSTLPRLVSYCWGKEHWLLGFDFQTNIVTRLWDLRSEVSSLQFSDTCRAEDSLPLHPLPSGVNPFCPLACRCLASVWLHYCLGCLLFVCCLCTFFFV